MSTIEKKAREEHDANRALAWKYHLPYSCWIDWFILGYNRAVKDNQWISVTDSLPENDCEVLPHIEPKYKEAFTEVLYFNKRQTRFYVFDVNKVPVSFISTVTHWMPIPTLPKKDA